MWLRPLRYDPHVHNFLRFPLRTLHSIARPLRLLARIACQNEDLPKSCQISLSNSSKPSVLDAAPVPLGSVRSDLIQTSRAAHAALPTGDRASILQ